MEKCSTGPHLLLHGHKYAEMQRTMRYTTSASHSLDMALSSTVPSPPRNARLPQWPRADSIRQRTVRYTISASPSLDMALSRPAEWDMVAARSA